MTGFLSNAFEGVNDLTPASTSGKGHADRAVSNPGYDDFGRVENSNLDRLDRSQIVAIDHKSHNRRSL